jgi:hypothetical protein
MHTGTKLGRARGRPTRIARRPEARLNHLATMPAQAPSMPCDFDATITINSHHLAAAGLSDRKYKGVAAVRGAVERMDGAHWIGVEAQSYLPELPGWVIVYPWGWCVMPDTPEWGVRQRLEMVASSALTAAGAPF